MRILVTGASGFVGRHVQTLPGQTDSLFTLSRGQSVTARHFAVDLVDARAVRDAMAEVAPDCVLHLAAIAQVRPGGERDAMAVNVDGAVHLADALWSVRPDARLLTVSTGYVLGETDHPAEEGAPVRPVGPYATSKARMEQAVARCSVGRDLCVVRPFNHTGPGQSASYAVTAFARKVWAAKRSEGTPTLSVGDLSAVRDLSDVRDLAHILRWLCTAPTVPPVVHACSGVGRTMASVLHDLCRLAGLDPDDVTIHSTGRSTLRRNVGRPTPLPMAGRASPTPWLDTLRDVLQAQSETAEAE